MENQDQNWDTEIFHFPKWYVSSSSILVNKGLFVRLKLVWGYISPVYAIGSSVVNWVEKESLWLCLAF